MPEFVAFLPLLVIAAMAAFLVLYARDCVHDGSRKRSRRERQTLDVQSHVGDPDDPTSGTF